MMTPRATAPAGPRMGGGQGVFKGGDGIKGGGMHPPKPFPPSGGFGQGGQGGPRIKHPGHLPQGGIGSGGPGKHPPGGHHGGGIGKPPGHGHGQGRPHRPRRNHFYVTPFYYSDAYAYSTLDDECRYFWRRYLQTGNVKWKRRYYQCID
ncbi:MAG: hypothetical protein ABL893_17740 [Hyphomicrobium sp.]